MYEQKNDYIIVAVAVIVLIACGWLYHDAHRNRAVYTNTDNTVEQLKDRIDSIEQRITTMQGRIEQNQKTIESVGRRISTSTGLAIEITESTGRTEERLNSAIQRSGRIANIISDIETANRKGTKNP